MNRKEFERAFNDKESGFNIASTQRLFETITILYETAITLCFNFPLLLLLNLHKSDIFIILLGAPVFIGDLLIHHFFIDKNDKYIKYFERFEQLEKEDERWFRKWKRITIAFMIGLIPATYIGIVTMCISLELLY